jgi:hypothetical protein
VASAGSDSPKPSWSRSACVRSSEVSDTLNVAVVPTVAPGPCVHFPSAGASQATAR